MSAPARPADAPPRRARRRIHPARARRSRRSCAWPRSSTAARRGDADRRGDAHVARGEGDALRVVPRGAGDDAARLLLVGERGELVVRPAQLERARLLQAVGLEVEAAVRHEALRRDHRRQVDDGGEDASRVPEQFHRDHRRPPCTCVFFTHKLCAFCFCTVYSLSIARFHAAVNQKSSRSRKIF